jgi:signal transduction histidine kinase
VVTFLRMRLQEVPRLYRRAILIYLATIVAPACGLLWLGVQSFERQRQALQSLTAEKLTAALETRTREAAESAFTKNDHPLAKHYFKMENGAIVQPRLHAPPPLAVPLEFRDAEHQELGLNRPDLALESYRKVMAAKGQEGLALSRIARCLAKLGRHEEARATWRKLASLFADERDLSHRPFGIVAAIEAGDTAGLYDSIASGRWDLSADQAEYFLSQLDPGRSSPYLNRFQFGRELSEQFRPQGFLRENETYIYQMGGRRIFYRSRGENQVRGFDVNDDWIRNVLRAQVQRELGITDTAARDLYFYGAAIAVVLIILFAGVVLLFRDVSRESHTSRLRSDFVSGVSHELKTPITLIRLYSETLLRQSGGEGERMGFYRIILRESERLGQLVDRIMTYSRMERGDQIYKLEAGDLASAIASVVDRYEDYLERAGFHLTRTLAERTPPVRFDASAVEQAVVNLLDNALKYSGESRDVTVRLTTHGRDVTVEVEDSGLGIAVAEQQKIFDRFHRVANGAGKGGYGLGLSLVRHIMEAHGGRAEVKSELGQGSCFRLVFPVEREWANNGS